METKQVEQVEQLKLNVTNIKSVLLSQNKKLRKFESQKSALVRKETQQEKRLKAEKKIEKVPGVPGPIGRVLGGIKGVAGSFFDKVLNSGGYLITGYLVTKLPEIVEKATEVYRTIKPIWDGAFKTLGFVFNGIKFAFEGITNLFNPEQAQQELDANQKELQSLERELDVEVSTLEGYEQTERSANDPNIMPDGSVIRIGDTVGSDMPTPTPVSTPPMQRRNSGGTVLRTTQPNRQPRRSTSSTNTNNALKRFSAVSTQNTEIAGLYKENVDSFKKLVKTLQPGSKKTGGSPTPTGQKPTSSGDNVPIASGPIQPGGSLDFIGSGDGASGTLTLKDASGKKIGSWSAISGTYGTAGTTQEQRASVSGALYPLPDGRYPLTGFQKHGYMAGIGVWSAYINNMSGSIGNRSQLLVHNDIGDNGTAGCVGVTLGGRSGTNADNQFAAAYEAVMPTSINVAIGRGASRNSNISSSKPKISGDNIPVPKDTEGTSDVIVMPIEVERVVPVTVQVPVSSGAGVNKSGNKLSPLHNIP